MKLPQNMNAEDIKTCQKEIPYILKWNTNNITNMRYMFNECLSLSSFPDILKWNTYKAKDINQMSQGSSSL